MGTSDHFGVFFFSDECWERTLWDGTCRIYVAPLAKLAVLRYYHALSRLAWPYQFLGSVVEFQEKKRHGTVQYGCHHNSKRPVDLLTRHCCYMISMRKTRLYHITALAILVHFTGSSQIWRLWLYG